MQQQNRNKENRVNNRVREIKCEHCNQPMELYMAYNNDNGKVVMIFDCRPCKRTCEIAAKTKPPEIVRNTIN